MFKKHISWLAVALTLLAGGFISSAEEPAKAAASPKKTEVKKVTPDAAQKLISEKKVIILDVRTEEEFKIGHIKGATNIDFLTAEFEKKIADLDKSKAYLVHCAAGSRSAKAIKKMEKLEFTKIYHLDCGLNGWEDAHKPTVKD